MGKRRAATGVGAEILAALTEIRDALRSGEPPEAKFTVHRVELDLAPAPYRPEDVRRVRDLLGASQPLFATLLGVDTSTVRSWEQGKRTPSPMARRFLDEIALDPPRWRARLESALRRTTLSTAGRGRPPRPTP